MHPPATVPQTDGRAPFRFLPLTTRHFVGRWKELEFLDAVWNDGQPLAPAVVVWGLGGVGKTTYLSEWLRRVARKVPSFAFSFYMHHDPSGPGSPAEQAPRQLAFFLGKAREYFELPVPPDDLARVAAALADHLRDNPCVVYLDGIETHQVPEKQGLGSAGQLSSPELSLLFDRLLRAPDTRGLCLLSSRFPVRAESSASRQPLAFRLSEELAAPGGLPALVDQMRGRRRPLEINLEGLLLEDGVDLLVQIFNGGASPADPPARQRTIDELGGEEELRRAVREVGGHALTLRLLGTYLRDINRDIRARDQFRLLSDSADWDGHAFRICQGYEQHLGTESPEWSVLFLLSFFDSEPGQSELALLRQLSPQLGWPILSLTDESRYHAALIRLRQAGLIFPPHDGRPDDEADFHPLIREYARRRLREFADTKRDDIVFYRSLKIMNRPRTLTEHESGDPWHVGHRELSAYYLRRVPPRPPAERLHGPLDPADREVLCSRLSNLCRAVYHACQAGDFAHAACLYFDEIKEGDTAFRKGRLAQHAAEVPALFAFFNGRWDAPSRGVDRNAFGLLNAAGLLLRSLGRSQEALQAERAFQLTLDHESSEHCLLARCTLSALHVTLGTDGFVIGRDHVERIRSLIAGADWQFRLRVHLAYLTHLAAVERLTSADLERVGGLFEVAETLRRVIDPSEEPPALLDGLDGFWYCDHLLEQLERSRAAPRGKRVRVRSKDTPAGRLADCREVKVRLVRILELAQQQGHYLIVALHRLVLGRACLLEEQLRGGTAGYAEARGQMDLGIELLRDLQANHQLPRALLARARLWRLLPQPDLAAAGKDLDEAFRLAERGGMQRYLPELHLEQAYLRYTQGDFEAALASAGKAAKFSGDINYRAKDREIDALLAQISSAGEG